MDEGVGLRTGGGVARDRRCFILDLHDDADMIAQYDHWHRPGGPPAAVTRAIRASGIIEMEIFRAADRLVMMVNMVAGFDPAARAASDLSDPEVVAWERQMDRFQKRLASAGEDTKWVLARSIYRLSDQPGDDR